MTEETLIETPAVEGFNSSPLGGRYFTWPDELDSMPGVEWLVDGLLPRDGLAMLVGPYSSGKSFLALDLALSVATGQRFHDRTVSSGPAVLIVAESPRGIRERLRSWEAARGVDVGSRAIALRCEPVELLDQRAVRRLISEAQNAYPDGVRVVVMDTLARCFSGDENAAKDAGAAISAADLIRRETGATVLLVHHSGKDGSTRGSTAFPGAADTVINVSKRGQLLTLRCGKQKDAEPFDDFSLRLVEFGESLALEEHDCPSNNQRASEGLDVMLDSLREFGPNGARFTEWHKATGLSKNSFNGRLKRLSGRVSQSDGRYTATATFDEPKAA